MDCHHFPASTRALALDQQNMRIAPLDLDGIFDSSISTSDVTPHTRPSLNHRLQPARYTFTNATSCPVKPTVTKSLYTRSLSFRPPSTPTGPLPTPRTYEQNGRTNIELVSHTITERYLSLAKPMYRRLVPGKWFVIG